ncbi:MAG: hypothetical protein ACRDPH_05255 [Marmoricola sp.]
MRQLGVPSLGVMLAMLVVGIVGGCAQSPLDSPTARPTPIKRLNTAALSVPRIDFCDLVPHLAVRQALGTKRWTRSSRGNGDTASVGTGKQQTTDVVAEHGCRWSTPGSSPAQASAWTFARPVHDRLARSVRSASSRERGCHDVDGPRFGHWSLTQVCRVGSPAEVRVRHAGLFGTTWLTCQVEDRSGVSDVRRRADAWCVQVANTLNTSH